jgi:hypothetical protein
MTSNRHPLRFFPLLAIAGLVLLAKILSFNGLYGQDAHEYLRQSKAIFDRLNGLTTLPEGRGDAEFAAGYPLAGALFQILGFEAATALQIVSWLSAGLALWCFDQCLRVLTPGARAESRWVFIALALALAPYFVWAGLTVMSDALGLALTLAAFANGLRVLETGRFSSAIWAAFFAGLAVTTRFSLAALLAPLAATLIFYLLENRRWTLAVVTILAGFLGILPHFLIKTGAAQNPLAHSLLQDWSLLHFFKATFSNANGTVDYGLPNILYICFPLAHPGFCLLLPGLFLLAKKTDTHLIAKRVLLASLVAYLLLLGGVPHQNLRYLLPAYAILLMLFFPAWDRMFAYGFYFFKRLTLGIIAVVLLLQIIFTVKILAPTIARNRLETAVAAEIRRALPPNATLFAFDLDVALRTYLPNFQIKNLWERRYEDFPTGSFILFNEDRLREQWQGQNPMLNWDFAKNNYELREVKELPEGWKLYEISDDR